MALTFDRDFDAPYGSLISVAPGIKRMLAHNPSPFTFKGTGVYVVGDREVAVIDPGPDDHAHLNALRKALAGLDVTHILVTHTHRDHSPAAEALKQWSGARTFGFGPHGAAAAEKGVVVEEGGDMDFVPDVFVKDGDVIEGNGFTFECVYTPGHTSNHVCYALRERKALFTGDHIMGWSTTVVAPPDGDMDDYLKSLEKLLVRGDEIYYPTHGAPIKEPKRVVKEYLVHRREREEQILAAMRTGATSIEDIVAKVYVGLDPRLLGHAAKSVEAHLIRLAKKGDVAVQGGEYWLSV